MLLYGSISSPSLPLKWKYEMASLTDEEEVNPNKKGALLTCRDFFWTYIPITQWLPKYKFKEYILGDLMAGLTLGCLHVPQALAFAMLAGVHPTMGLCTSCLSVYVYCLFGTAVISSYGTVAIASLLTGNTIYDNSDSKFTNEELASAITFLIGIYYAGAFILRFWVVTKLFTKAFSTAFILSCAIRVILKALKLLLDLHIKEEKGIFSVFRTVYYTFKALPSSNLITMGLSISILAVFTINTFLIKPALEKKTKFVLPIELITMILASTLSYTLTLETYEVSTTGYVPRGFPDPAPPKMGAVDLMYGRSIIIAVVNFATSITMVIVFNPDVRPNQELLALSLSNLICCCFYTLPFGNSMMRTVIAQHCGINTLMADIISSTIVLMVILFMGPVFEPLPTCVLGCIIIYGLVTLSVKQIKTFPEVYSTGWENRFIWIVTFLTTLLIAIEIGIIAGMILTIRQFLANPTKFEAKTQRISHGESLIEG